MTEISAACREQDIGADQINQAIQQLDKVTQQNASASEQMSATSEELAAQAEQLQSSIAYFRIDANAAGGNATRWQSGGRATPRRTAPVARRHAPAKPAVKIPRPTPVAQQAGLSATARPMGFVLNLTTGGADQHDAEFERM